MTARLACDLDKQVTKCVAEGMNVWHGIPSYYCLYFITVMSNP